MKDTVKVTAGKSTAEPRTQLLNGHDAPSEFYIEVYESFYIAVTSMVLGLIYTAKDIAPEYWDSLPTNKWKRLAGRCFAHMVSTNQFPVKFAHKNSRTKHYQTK